MRINLSGFLAILVVFSAISNVSGTEPEKPKLLVLVVFDQLRGDYPHRWGSLFVDGGFKRLQSDGAWFRNCHYPYATTQTGPGHAAMLTGCSPNQHGIPMNQWYDRQTSTVVNCAQSARYQRVPALVKEVEPEQPKETEKLKVKLAGSPEWLLVPTIGDVLKEATKGKAKVVGLSFKDRSALLPVGRSADAVYWLDSTDGMIVTSSFYRDSVHPWVAEFNKTRMADRWFGREWSHLLSNLDYQKNSGPDEVEGEGKGMKQGIVFPHPTDGGLKKPGKNYYDALYNSPFGNEMLFELVKKAVVAEKLGDDDVTDLLVVSFSSNDAIGHCWGPDSQEVLDATLRSDRMMVEFLAFLDKTVGRDRYLLALTADHGICPLPEVTAAKGTFAKRLPGKKIFTAAEDHLRSKYDLNPLAKSNWIESVQPPWLYLNQPLIASKGLKSEDVEKELAQFLAKQEGFQRLFTRADLAKEFPENDPIGGQMKQSYFPERCGEVGYVLEPFCLLDTA
ncbi:MAG: alkaline phosphatase family protein, partial [Planctomycetes bacterium]|nr:alkaline phosphatase family protein [Planctomycetota bacterium]